MLSLPQEAELERLEREFAIQSQITEAARRLASDPNVSKKLKKQRKTSYLNALKKLQEIENAINENRVKSGKKPTQRASLIIDGQCWALSPLQAAPLPQEPGSLHDLGKLVNHLYLTFSIHKMKLIRPDTNESNKVHSGPQMRGFMEIELSSSLIYCLPGRTCSHGPNTTLSPHHALSRVTVPARGSPGLFHSHGPDQPP